MEDVQREVNSFKGKSVSQKASGKDSLKRNRIDPLAQKVKDDLKKHDYDMEDLADTTTKVRKQIVKWQHGQNNVRLSRLKEHKDYEIEIKRSVHPDDTFTAAVFCIKCNKKIHLGVNQNGVVKLSNWIRHIKPCVQEKRPKKESQLELTKYFGNSSSSVSSPDMSTPISEISTPDAQTSDLTDFPSDKSAMAMPESNSSDSDPSAKSATSMPESNSRDQNSDPSAKSATSMPESNSRDQNSDPSAKSTTSMPESNSRDQNSDPLAKSATSMPESNSRDQNSDPSAKSATSMPESNGRDQNSDPSPKSTTSMPESNSNDEGFQGAPPIAKK